MQFEHLLKLANNRLNDLRNNPETLLSTGLTTVDDALGGGIAAGEVAIIAARPSHGKTSLLLNMLLAMAKNGQPGLIINEEMAKEMIAERTIQMATAIRKPDWPTRSEDVAEDLGDWWGTGRRSVLVAQQCSSIDNVCNAIREAKDNHGTKVVAVDYLQLIRGPGMGRYEQVTAVSVLLKQVAIECGVTMLIAAQLNRELLKRGDGTPRVSDLRESGQIEQDADVILSGYWPRQDDPNYQGDVNETGFASDEEYRIHVHKNRNRGIRSGVVLVGFNASRQTFFDLPVEAMKNYETAFDNF